MSKQFRRQIILRKKNRGGKPRGKIKNKSPLHTFTKTDIETSYPTIYHARRSARGTLVRIPRMVYAPDSVIADLVFINTTTLTLTNVGQPYTSKGYRANSVYDPDPAFSSSSVPGYTFYTGAYQNYRVLSLGYSISLCNKESFPVSVVAIPTNDNIGGNYASIGEMQANPHATVSMLSAKGGLDKVDLKGSIDLGTFSGNVIQYLGDDNFEGPVGGNPTYTIFFNVGAFASQNFTAGNGLDIRLSLTYTTLWTSRKTAVS